METKFVLNIKDWKLTRLERSKNRMKLQLKFNKDETMAIKNFMEMVKPPEISEDDFLKGLFKLGIETMESKLMQAVEEHMEENDLDPSAIGVKPDHPEEIVVPVVGEVSELKSTKDTKDEL
tara:strand:- start:1646 stop:2008 length:363 start_codon:yes stop_codon:yes gene_type:complete